jgi:adenylate cyclase
MWHRLSLRNKILVATLALVVGLLVAALVVVDVLVRRQVLAGVQETLDRTAVTVRTIQRSRTHQLLSESRILTQNWVFKNAVTTYDPDTVSSAVQTFQAVIGADLFTVTDEEAVVLARAQDPGRRGDTLRSVPTVRRALEGEETTGIAPEGAGLYQLVVSPLLAGVDIVGTVALGYRIDDAVAREIREISNSEVSFLVGNRVVASSLSKGERTQLDRVLAGPSDLRSVLGGQGARRELVLGGERYASLLIPMGAREGGGVAALVQVSPDRELQFLRGVRALLLATGAAVAGVGLVMSLRVSRGITEPVNDLVRGIRQVGAGDFGGEIPVRSGDELGELARAFNVMSRGLADRERVRGVLDKVVSPEVADQLLRGHLVLGGEQREVTVLFSDIRGFSPLAEQLPPQALVALLNRYLTVMTERIHANGGIVDKFIGDGIMAMFGAPVQAPDDSQRAVRAACEMVRALERFNAEQEATGAPPLRMGVGISTGLVVAGNVGSPGRLNYTVLGDTVNVAARLEGLTKDHGKPIIIGESTARQVAAHFVLRALGDVPVRGRAEPLQLYAVEGDDLGPLA